MKMLKILILICLITPAVVSGQCKKFTKNKCLPMLGDYLPNDNFNSEVFMPGDEAEVSMTFFADQSYRIFVCNQEILGEVSYTVKDMNDFVVFDSQVDPEPTFDFKADNTIKLKVHLTVPELENRNQLIPQGCVSIVLGHKGKAPGDDGKDSTDGS